jgi:hypothetical protein
VTFFIVGYGFVAEKKKGQAGKHRKVNAYDRRIITTFELKVMIDSGWMAIKSVGVTNRSQ